MIRIGRTLAYDMVGRYEASGGTDGLPAIRVSGCLRVPKWALAVWISTGCVVCLIPQSVEGEGAPGADEGRRAHAAPSARRQSAAQSPGAELRRSPVTSHSSPRPIGFCRQVPVWAIGCRV